MKYGTIKMITLNNLSLDFAGNIIFNNISIQIKKMIKYTFINAI